MAAAGNLGLLAGLGDAAHEHNQRRLKQEDDVKNAFAGDLQRVMESEDWPEQSRMAAAHARYQLLSGGVKQKDYQKLWQSVHEASGRPGEEAPQVAAARSDLPSLQHMQGTLPAAAPIEPPQAAPVPQNNSLGLLAPSGDNVQGQNVFGPTQGRMGLQAPQPPQQNTVLQPPSFGQAVEAQVGQAQDIVSAAPPPPVVYGPTTRAEKNQQAMDMFKQQLNVQQQAQREQFAFEQAEKDKYAVDKNYVPVPKGSRYVLNPQTGQLTEVPNNGDDTSGETTPEKMLIDAERRKVKAAGGNPDDPAQMESIILGVKRRMSEAGRDPEAIDIRRLALEISDQQHIAQSYNTFQNDIAQFRQEYTGQMKNNTEALNAANADIEFLKAAKIGTDFGAIYKTMRMFDPSSVVREQEFAAGQKIGDWWDANIGNKLQQWSGKGYLTDNSRKEMMVAATKMKEIVAQAQQRLNDRYMPAADASGLPFDQIGFTGLHTYQPGANYRERPLYKSVLEGRPGFSGQKRSAGGPPTASPVLDAINKAFGANK